MNSKSDAPNPELSPKAGPPGWPDWIERYVLPISRTNGLGVIPLILLFQVVMVMSVAEVFAFRDRHIGGMFGMFFLVMASVETVRLERSWHHKMGWMTATMGLCWLASIGLSLLVAKFGVL